MLELQECMQCQAMWQEGKSDKYYVFKSDFIPQQNLIDILISYNVHDFAG